MANRTVKDAVSIRGTNPQYLIEKIIRSRVYDSQYWKEECFALTAELLVDKAMEINYIGGVYGGNIKPTPFVCLLLKMLQIQPEKDIIVEFIKNEEFKIQRRQVLEANNELEPRVSVLEEGLDDGESEEEEEPEDVHMQYLPSRIPRYPDASQQNSHSLRDDNEKLKERDRERERNRRKRSHSRERKHHHSRVHESRRLKLRKKHREKDKEEDKEKDGKELSKHSRHADSSKEKEKEKKSKEKDKQTSSKATRDLEIQEANALRAKLGMAPLRN